MIKWKQRPSGMHKAECGDLTLEAFDYDSKFRAIVSVEERELLNAFDFDTLDAAKLAAETFAREWVAALGNGWIPVGERLPEDDTKMLVLAAHPGCAPFYSTARYFLDSDRWHTDGGDSYGGITHWRELPPPPPLPVGEVEE